MHAIHVMHKYTQCVNKITTRTISNSCLPGPVIYKYAVYSGRLNAIYYTNFANLFVCVTAEIYYSESADSLPSFGGDNKIRLLPMHNQTVKAHCPNNSFIPNHQRYICTSVELFVCLINKWSLASLLSHLGNVLL